MGVAAFVMAVGAFGMIGFAGGEDTCVQAGEDAEDEKPCEKVPH